MDETRPIAEWLRRQNRAATQLYLFGAVGTFLVGLLILAVTWWAIYLTLLIGVEGWVELGHVGRMVVAGVIVVLLFPLNAWTDRRELEQFSFTTGTASDKPVSIYIPGVGMGSTINPLAPDSFRSFARAIATLLLFGPRVVTAAVRMVLLARQLQAMDVEGAAAVLAVLAQRDKRVPLKQIVRAFPPGHDLQTVLTQLREVEGVLFLLQSEPAGMSLTTELRTDLRRLLRDTV